MDRKGGGRGGPSFDNESINLGIYIYIYTWMYPFSRKYFSARERGAARKDSILSNIFSSPPFFPQGSLKNTLGLYLRFRYESRTEGELGCFFLFVVTRVGERKKERERGGKDYSRSRNGRLFETVRNAALDQANEGSRVVFEIESGSARLGPSAHAESSSRVPK